MDEMREQALRFGADLRMEDVDAVSLDGPVKSVTVGDETYRARAVILAMGAAARHLGVPGEEALIGMGVSTCATCDGFFFRDQDIAVVGGGDSAMEEATFLTRFARSVTLIHRRDEFRASKIMLERARANEKITFLTNTQVTAIEGDPKVTGVRLRNAVTGEESDAGRHRCVRRDRPRPPLGSGSRPGRPRPGGLRAGRGPHHRAPRSKACSPQATSSTTPTARPSPRQAPAVRPRSTPSAGSPKPLLPQPMTRHRSDWSTAMTETRFRNRSRNRRLVLRRRAVEQHPGAGGLLGHLVRAVQDGRSGARGDRQREGRRS